ncbi:MAG: TonB-dependent receptor [Desulfobacterales bacterium]|nr:TonB-dependent receptor [Desulfobacterales bacterium]
MNRLSSLAFLLFLLINSSYVFSQSDSTSEPTKLDSELNEAFKWLQVESITETEIATKTRLDADLAPGMVTVLTGEILERKGFRTVGEAMNYIPGFSSSTVSTIVRGIGEIFNSGKVKLLLNDVPMNENLSGGSSTLFMIPIQQVKRIEIIRGPGSAIYGKWAYSAVINIVTKDQENCIFTQYGTFDAFSIGTLLSYSQPQQDFSISLNTAYWKRNQSDIVSGPDVLYGTPNESVSLAPGRVDDSMKSGTGILNLNYKDFILTGQFTSKKMSNPFGFLGALPLQDDEDRSDIEQNHSVRLSLSPKLTDTLDMKFHMGCKVSIYDEDNAYLYPPGFSIPDLGTYENGWIGGPHYEERSLDSGLELHWIGWNDHLLMAGGEYERIDMMDIWARKNYDQDYMPLPSPEHFTGEGNWIDEDKRRGIFGIFFQDQFKVIDSFTLTAGLRYDNYDDTANRLSPRIAGVFHPFEQHIFKIQYAESFRPPTFMEMYSKNNPVVSGNPDIVPEVIKTSELGYIFRIVSFVSKLNLFYSELKKSIVQDGFQYSNSGGAQIKGGEIEIKWKILHGLSLDGNLSYVKTKDKDTGEEIAGSANWIGNTGITYEPVQDYLLSLHYFYSGKRNRSPEDARGKLDSYDMVRLSASAENFLIKGLTLRLAANNIFDKNIRFPSSDYPEDYPTVGYEMWGLVSYEF